MKRITENGPIKKGLLLTHLKVLAEQGNCSIEQTAAGMKFKGESGADLQPFNG